jgi:hypothetical protein
VRSSNTASAGVVDEHVELIDLRRRLADLPRIGDVEEQRRDPRIVVGQRSPRCGVHASGTAPQRLVDERGPEAAVGAGDQNRPACELRAAVHRVPPSASFPV